MSGEGPVVALTCDVSGRIDLGVVDVLARLQVLAQRRGVTLRIRASETTGEALRSLLALAGLDALDQTLIEPLEPSG